MSDGKTPEEPSTSTLPYSHMGNPVTEGDLEEKHILRGEAVENKPKTKKKTNTKFKIKIKITGKTGKGNDGKPLTPR